MAKLHTKRVYDELSKEDGQCVLVDRLWPRGLSKSDLKGVIWLKEISPSSELRKWYHAHLGENAEFHKRYKAELKDNPDAVAELRALAKKGRVTLLYGSKSSVKNSQVIDFESRSGGLE
ncbi:MAG TPA: DUF488 family protein [Rhizomicrobium sp.]|nr:DUF488 family protein [Rhizomicrobium sp.]